jgi:hypothetical protein
MEQIIKNVVVAHMVKFTALYGTQMFIAVLTLSATGTQPQPVESSPHTFYLFEIHFNIILICTPSRHPCSRCPPLEPTLSQLNLVHTHSTSLRSMLILYLYVRLVVSSFYISPIKFVISKLPLLAFYPANLILLDLISLLLLSYVFCNYSVF